MLLCTVSSSFDTNIAVIGLDCWNKKVDVKFSARDTFLQKPSSGTLNIGKPNNFKVFEREV